MKRRYYAICFGVLMAAGNLCAQSAVQGRLFVPLLDRESQSNVVVTVANFAGQPCPAAYTNLLANTNLFTTEQYELIREALVKYKNVTTNVGPPGTKLISLYKTNFTIKGMYNRTANVENWVVRYEYTNTGAYDEVTIGMSLSAKFRTKTNTGYNVQLGRTGNGSILRFIEVKQNLTTGVLAQFEDLHPQGTNWNFRLTDFSDSPLSEYRQYTNGLVLGKFLMWNPRNGQLLLDADFKEPYDWMAHYHPPSFR